MKIFKKLVLSIICIIIIFSLLVFYELSTIIVRDTKDFSRIYVKDEFDYKMMVYPPEEYSALLQIDISMRKRVASYMKENNLRLKMGEQEFVRNEPTIDELIDDEYGFAFEKIEE